MLEFFVDNVSSAWAVFIIALLPMFESKVAIPFGMTEQIWGADALSPIVSFFVALAGSVAPIFVIILLTKIIKHKTSGFICDRLVYKFKEKHADKLKKIGQKDSIFRKCVAIAIFVAIPLPLTGVYTGSVIAGFTSLKLWHGFLSVFVGEIVSCSIVLLLSTIFDNSAFYILLISLILIVIFIFANLLLALLKKTKKEKR